MIEDEILHEFDTGGAFQAFSRDEREALLKIASQRPGSELIKQVQDFFFQRREALKAFAVHRIPVLPGVAGLYAQRIGQTANREGNGGQVLNKLEIDRTGFDPVSRKPVLFGSSLKGAIRTALLDELNQGKRAPEKKGLHEFQGRLLLYRDTDQGRLHLERDPLRLVQLSDAPWRLDGDLPTTQIHLAVNRKKASVKDARGHLRPAMGENLYQILECVPAWRHRAFGGQVNFQSVDGVRPSGKLPAAGLHFAAGDIAAACNRFYLPILTGERRLMSERGYVDPSWNESIGRVLELCAERIRRGEVFLLRVGRHSGVESVTVSGARNGHIRIMKGKGQPAEYADAARTLWLAADKPDQRTGLLPFGWLLIELQPQDRPEPAWPELAAVCEPHLVAARSFGERIAQQQRMTDEARERLQQQRQREAEAARTEAEARARAEQEEAERRARMAAMSDNQRHCHMLRGKLSQANRGRGAGDQLYGQARDLVQSASGWPDAERAVLRAVAVEIFDWLGIKKDDAKRKALLRALSG